MYEWNIILLKSLSKFLSFKKKVLTLFWLKSDNCINLIKIKDVLKIVNTKQMVMDCVISWAKFRVARLWERFRMAVIRTHNWFLILLQPTFTCVLRHSLVRYRWAITTCWETHAENLLCISLCKFGVLRKCV